MIHRGFRIQADIFLVVNWLSPSSKIVSSPIPERKFSNWSAINVRPFSPLFVYTSFGMLLQTCWKLAARYSFKHVRIEIILFCTLLTGFFGCFFCLPSKLYQCVIFFCVYLYSKINNCSILYYSKQRNWLYVLIMSRIGCMLLACPVWLNDWVFV